MLSLALALVMCLGLTAPAFAADYTEVVPCKHDKVEDFSEGLAAVCVNSKWGFICLGDASDPLNPASPPEVPR